jgi:uncharacterized tellurite resistance protein B-like protein
MLGYTVAEQRWTTLNPVDNPETSAPVRVKTCLEIAMLLDSVRALFRVRPAEEVPAPDVQHPAADPLHLAACALLLEIAHADGEFSVEERAHLEGVLERHFELPPESGRRLIELAEREQQEAIDHFRFTSILQREYDLGQKMVLAEVMWGLVLADGQIAEHEQYLTRKIANLLDLKPGYLHSARNAAVQARGEA